MVKDPACLSRDALADLGKGDAVTVFAKAKGSAANVEKHFQFSAGQVGHEGIKDVVGDLGRVRELETRECGLICSGHQKTSGCQTSSPLDLYAGGCYPFFVGNTAVGCSLWYFEQTENAPAVLFFGLILREYKVSRQPRLPRDHPLCSPYSTSMND
jgi:hypothetical protein